MHANPAMRSPLSCSRREFLVRTSIAAVGLSVAGPDSLSAIALDRTRFPISLAQWSLHRMLGAGQLHPLDFPEVTKSEYGLGAVEYVNTFYRDLPAGWTRELKARCEGSGVRSLLIMCDGEGRIGDPDPHARSTTIENHVRWLDAASELGCHSIRVNAASEGAREEQSRLAADGLRRLAERADPCGLSVLVENHGGLSSDASWLSATIRAADHPRLGTLPDFGNWQVSDSERYDPYLGLSELMPLAGAVSAKSHDFGADGEEIGLDYRRLLRIVRDSGYEGWIGIEYEGQRLSEPDGIRATKGLLEKTFAEMGT
ncbi:MAG: sugar phosphate isomerase/epimerase [marine benthic group bacterium]|nr:sugar phosphate isomerase/epimerase [Gemmatimonadota bacterium]